MRIKVDVKKGSANFASIARRAHRLRQKAGKDPIVKAGLLGDHKNERPDATTNVGLGMIQEFGLGVPARSFIRAPFKKNKSTYIAPFRKALWDYVARGVRPDFVLNRLGMKMAADMKNYVTQGPSIPPPLAESTIAAKRRKGAWKKNPRNDVRALIDTGRLVGSITWAILKGLIK